MTNLFRYIDLKTDNFVNALLASKFWQSYTHLIDFMMGWDHDTKN
jgi:hypothetical protein